MARPVKTGLDYFSLDVDIDQDDKIYMIEAELGEISFGRIIKLLAEIYRGDGYFKKWEEEDVLIFCGKKRIPIEEAKSLVTLAVKRGLFDKVMFERFHILTSRGIQKRYIAACENRAKIPIYKEFVLFRDTDFPTFLSGKIEKNSYTAENPGYTPENPSYPAENPGFSVDNSTERKGKEKKVKESKGGDEKEFSTVKLESELLRMLSPFSTSIINLISTTRKHIENFCTLYGLEEFFLMIKNDYIPAKAETGKIRFINEDLPAFIKRHQKKLKSKPKYIPDPDIEDIKKNGTEQLSPEETQAKISRVIKTAKKKKMLKGVCESCKTPLEINGSGSGMCPKCKKRYEYDEVFRKFLPAGNS